MSRSGLFTPPPPQTVIYGKPVAAALNETATLRDARRAVLVTNTSLGGPDGLAAKVKQALGRRCVAVLTGVKAHSPRADVMRIAAALRQHEADLVVGLGGGSVCDAVKAACLVFANRIEDSGGIDRLRKADHLKAAHTPFAAIPTTLSAGEYTGFAGITDERIPRKEVLFHPSMAPDLVILDAEMTITTPPRLFFGTGIRAVDHGIETWCSVNFTPLVEATALHALGILPRALAYAKSNPGDLDNRLDCMIGAWLSVQGVSTGVDLGASHGIGHVLGGTAGMAHGETSCVMLPHVLRYNAAVNAERQAALAAAMGDADTPVADQVAALVSTLELPGRLRDAEVPRELLPKIAEESMLDMWIKTNPRRINGPRDILPLLEAAW